MKKRITGMASCSAMVEKDLMCVVYQLSYDITHK